MRAIQQEIARGMAAGAAALSTGLEYVSECFAGTDELNSIDQLRAKIAYLRELSEEVGRTRPMEICTGRFGMSGQLNRGGTSDAAKAIDDYAELAEAGVTWVNRATPAAPISSPGTTMARTGIRARSRPATWVEARPLMTLKGRNPSPAASGDRCSVPCRM